MFQSMLRHIGTLALALGLISLSNAAVPQLPNRDLYCGQQFSICMLNHQPVRVCSAQRADCLRNAPRLDVLVNNVGLPLPTNSAEDALRFQELLTGKDRAPQTAAVGSTYCRKMLARCDAGDQSACDLFERYCATGG